MTRSRVSGKSSRTKTLTCDVFVRQSSRVILNLANGRELFYRFSRGQEAAFEAHYRDCSACRVRHDDHVAGTRGEYGLLQSWASLLADEKRLEAFGKRLRAELERGAQAGVSKRQQRHRAAPARTRAG
ncbi:MAG: hypothetical protein HY814_01845 [Candidatus Riflebacteria bacterium]|nr:hypothetical protein [Candidatus Riflebacteria bacterium]